MAAEIWGTGLKIAEDLRATEPSLGIERYLFAHWCFAQARSWERNIQIHAPNYPVGLNEIGQMSWQLNQAGESGRFPLRVWRDSEDFAGLLDEEARRFWRRNKSTTPVVRKAPTEDELITNLRSSDRYNLSQIVQHAALAMERRLADEANSVRSLAELYSVHGMEDWTRACLDLWANTLKL